MTCILVEQNVVINNSGATPSAFSILDVVSSDKRILIPRIELTATNVVAPLYSPATSLWYEVGSTTTPYDISDCMSHTGNVATKNNTVDFPLNIESGITLVTIQSVNYNSDPGDKNCIYNTISGNANEYPYGMRKVLSNNGIVYHCGGYNVVNGGAGVHLRSYREIGRTGCDLHYVIHRPSRPGGITGNI